MFKLHLEKAEKPEVKLKTSVGSSKKAREFQKKKSASVLLTMPKPLIVWITTNWIELLSLLMNNLAINFTILRIGVLIYKFKIIKVYAPFFIQFSSVQSLSHVWLFVTPWTAARQASLSCSSPTPRVYSNLCSSSRWCHPTISSSVIPFSSHLQSFPESESFQMNQFFTSGSQSTGVSASASVLQISIQDWFPLGWTVLNSLLSKGLSRVFSNSTVQIHQFFGNSQLSL